MSADPYTILHVEDDPNDVLLVQRALKKCGAAATLQMAADGDQAVAYLSGSDQFADREKFPLPVFVLLDLKLPRKSGLEVLEWIRKNPALKKLIVVIFTSSKHDRDINDAYALGANSYLVKPVGFDSLRDGIEQVCRYWGELNQKPVL
jgi:CheY-like chemotaxis protein